MEESKTLHKPLRISMQYFADGGDSSTTGAVTGSTGNAGSSSTNNTNATQNSIQSQNNDSQSNSENTSSIEKLIQSAVDRATNKLGNENKNLKKQLDEIMKQKLTDDERVELERKQEREQFEQEKAQFIAEKNRLHAETALAKADLGISGDNLEKVVPLVIGKDETEIDENVKVLCDIVKELVAGKVANTFKESGRTPTGSGTSGAGKAAIVSHSVATAIGKAASEANKKSAEVLKYYTGG